MFAVDMKETARERQQDTSAVNNGAHEAVPRLHPGGTPRVTDDGANVSVEVVSIPAEFVKIKVANVGVGEIVGMAEALKKLMPTTGL